MPALVHHFSRLFSQRYQREPIVVSDAVRTMLIAYPWPGNVRELCAWIERLYVTGLQAEVLVEMLLGEVDLGITPISAGSTSLAQVERQAIVQALERSNFNQRKAARMLQVHRATLARKLKKHRLA